MAPPAHVACGVFPLRRSALSWLACVSIALAMPVLTPNPAAAAELSPAAVAEMFLKALELQGRGTDYSCPGNAGTPRGERPATHFSSRAPGQRSHERHRAGALEE
jgi:hypothetical protein